MEEVVGKAEVANPSIVKNLIDQDELVVELSGHLIILLVNCVLKELIDFSDETITSEAIGHTIL